MKISILLVDDHPIMRQALRQLLEPAANLVIIGEAGRGKEAIQMVAGLQPDVLLLDWWLPDLKAPEVLREIEKLSVRTRVIVVSTHSDPEYIREAFLRGAYGYVSKNPDDLQALAEAIYSVAKGQRFSRPDLRIDH